MERRLSNSSNHQAPYFKQRSPAYLRRQEKRRLLRNEKSVNPTNVQSHLKVSSSRAEIAQQEESESSLNDAVEADKSCSLPKSSAELPSAVKAGNIEVNKIEPLKPCQKTADVKSKSSFDQLNVTPSLFNRSCGE